VVPRTAVYRFYNGTTGAHFFTSSAAERDEVIAGNPSFNYEGIAFYAYATQVTGSSAVYRFYNRQTGRHFYTIAPAERDTLMNSSGYTYEGPVWYAQEAAGGSATAAYRFYKQSKDTHFYTVSEAKRTSSSSTIRAGRWKARRITSGPRSRPQPDPKVYLSPRAAARRPAKQRADGLTRDGAPALPGSYTLSEPTLRRTLLPVWL
jgi:hypothetical protein